MAVIFVKNVRASYFNDSIWKPDAYEEGQEKKYKINGLVPKGSAQDKLIESTILAVAKEAWKEKAAGILAKAKADPTKYCYRDGDGSELDGYEGMNVLSVNNKKRPPVYALDGEATLAEEDGVVYSGCYVNLKVEIWAQDNKYGKAIRGKLLGIQFFKEGDSFSAGAPVAAAGEFENLSDGAGAEDLT